MMNLHKQKGKAKNFELYCNLQFKGLGNQIHFSYTLIFINLDVTVQHSRRGAGNARLIVLQVRGVPVEAKKQPAGSGLVWCASESVDRLGRRVCLSRLLSI